MIWLMFLVPLALLIAVAIYIEKRGNRSMEDASLSKEDKEILNEEYLDHGAQTEVHSPKNMKL
ncbi:MULTISPECIES: hypothetical protein [Thalassobacillus]|uniref:hypothetical protein n=1 Tax=Thalassobacillus TaxID=331971 RepID=UPI000A1CB10E|nr:hypothetical protein [Thalassobacillus devorans]